MDFNHSTQTTTLENLKSFEELPREVQSAITKHDTRQAKVALRSGWGATTKGMALTQQYLPRLGAAFRVALSGDRRADASATKMLKVVGKLDPDVMALCVLQQALHTLAARSERVTIAKQVGRALSGECWAAGLTESDAKRAKAIGRRVKLRYSSATARLEAAKREAAATYKLKNGVTVNPYMAREWTNEFQVRAGMWALSVLTEALPDALRWREETVGTSRGVKTAKYLQVADEAWYAVDEALNAKVIQRPVWFPMLMPPKAWDAWAGCGSTDERISGSVKFLRSRHKSTGAAVRAAIKTGQMQPALDAVNTLQNVAWRINDRIFDVLVECYNRGIKVKGLPSSSHVRPKRSTAAAWEAMDTPQRKLKKMHDEQLTHLYDKTKCDAVLFAGDMNQARELAVHERFYTPMNCDWRGRVYSLCHFNFQRDDRVRALFLFAEGDPIGEDGLKWLKVHAANCGDFGKISKRPMTERAQWFDDNIAWITKCAQEPLKYVDWTDADKPFLFLAAAMELIAAIEAGPSYTSRLPVSFDGSCSGLQHLSAMTRAEEGSLVNLTPAPLPQDIYNTVADLVTVRLTAALTTAPENTLDDEEVKTAARKREMAKLALEYKLGRSDVKRGVMTYAYSSKKFGMACQLQTDLMKPLAQEVLEGKRPEHPFAPYQDGTEERPSTAARFLADHIFESIESVVHKPAEAMKFLQKLAKALAHEGKPLRWTTPVGIPWINRYHDPITKRVELWLHDGGVRVRSLITVAVDDKPEINKDQAANGVAPNFVHALDASHLLLVANAARVRGIVSIATVHDSFGCLASQASDFNVVIREKFVEMYEKHDVLAEILAQAKCDLTDDNSDRLPDAIAPGPLNLREILNADFAFA